METKKREELTTAGTITTTTPVTITAVVDITFNSARLLWAYKYIDHLQLPHHGTYDGFMEFQVRHLTKVVFVAMMMMVVAVAIASDTTAPENKKEVVAKALDRVISLPDNAVQMLGPFLNPNNVKVLDKLYDEIFKRSSQLHADARALKANDAIMRIV